MGGDKIGHGSQGHYGQNKMEKQMVSVSDVYCAIKMQFIDRGTIKATAPRLRRGKSKCRCRVVSLDRIAGRHFTREASDNIMASTNLPLR